MRKGKRKTDKVKVDTSINGDSSVWGVDLQGDEGKKLVKIDRTTWILVKHEKFEAIGEEGCRQEFTNNLISSRSKTPESK